MRISSILAAVLLSAGTTIATVSVGNSETALADAQLVPQDLKVVAQADQSSANRRKRRPTDGLQIACTRVGCNPIPRGCQIEKEYGWDGLPTGYDLVVCPFR